MQQSGAHGRIVKNVVATLMKSPIIIVLFAQLSLSGLSGQSTSLCGSYRADSNTQITLESDSTFLFTFQNSNIISWDMGYWSANNDTLLLTVNNIYDTIMVLDSLGSFVKDSLVLSQDMISNQSERLDLISQALSSGGENRFWCPTKFLIKRRKLVVLDFRIGQDLDTSDANKLLTVFNRE